MSLYHINLRPVLLASLLLTHVVSQTLAQTIQVSPNTTLESSADPAKGGPLDLGKMWTFDNPPRDYFSKTYKFSPDEKWFDEARLASLRFADYCSASFVSANGLVMTNHHCARESGTGVTRKGEDLNATGFFAKTPAEERKVDGLFVDQLVKIEDITKRVQDAMTSAGQTDASQLEAREKTFEDIKREYGTKADWKGLELQTIVFYSGGRYSLYGFKRYTDVRLVFMPELALGFFGGDYDNFTYPRYALDCSFFRVYDNGKPLKTAHFFKFNPSGVRDGEPIFVIGNPGHTERLKTVAELEFDRDLQTPATIQMLQNRADALRIYNETAKSDSILNEIFSYDNSLKAYGGQLAGLRDASLLARKAVFEEQFKMAAKAKNLPPAQLKTWDEIASNTAQLRSIFRDANYLAPSERTMGELMTFANVATQFGELLTSRPQDAERARSLMEAPNVKNLALDEAYLAAHLTEAQIGLGNDDPYVKAALTGPDGKTRTPKEAAAYLIKHTKLNDPAFIKELSTRPGAVGSSDDPLLVLARIGFPRYVAAGRQARQITQNQEVLHGQLGRMLYDVYGTAVPPDATFSLRINDGVVKSFDYNGTKAPILTTFAGLYDRNYSFADKAPWNLPARWKNPPMELLKQPMCFISTNDIIGGNSGSPMINKNLEAVGLAFDGNMESLPGEFIFVPDANRTISVHAGGIIAAMRYIYKADRLVTELVGTATIAKPGTAKK
ncbi:S46 family peptidase [Spirosoma endophyticum]|uniref:Dipeptidyl-peptidase n=1 Tax=Spirosoma endophyticum TaxID=662367 RepID=A0A1I1SZH5_9BACT|nr:S46 family peptidase [Spirosoma endophyticum]SFD51855.1 dipeptidyl-peptidase 7. Serine peptidase. MEROPS family S46 [Spirosoma endophyticum]